MAANGTRLSGSASAARSIPAAAQSASGAVPRARAASRIFAAARAGIVGEWRPRSSVWRVLPLRPDEAIASNCTQAGTDPVRPKPDAAGEDELTSRTLTALALAAFAW